MELTERTKIQAIFRQCKGLKSLWAPEPNLPAQRRKSLKELQKDPTRKCQTELIRMLRTLEKGKITKDQYWYSYPTLERVPPSTTRALH